MSNYFLCDHCRHQHEQDIPQNYIGGATEICWAGETEPKAMYDHGRGEGGKRGYDDPLSVCASFEERSKHVEALYRADRNEVTIESEDIPSRIVVHRSGRGQEVYSARTWAYMPEGQMPEIRDLVRDAIKYAYELEDECHGEPELNNDLTALCERAAALGIEA